MSFKSEIDSARKLIVNAQNEIVRTATLNLFGSVIRDTPVDTGRARGEWQTTVDQPAQGLNGRLNRSGVAGSYAEAVAKTPLEAGSEVFLTNNLDYIEGLEYGRSNQAPEGMVRRNVARVQRIVRQAVAKLKV